MPGLFRSRPIPFAPEKLAGMVNIVSLLGQSLTLRYRLVFHRGPAKDAKLDKGSPSTLRIRDTPPP